MAGEVVESVTPVLPAGSKLVVVLPWVTLKLVFAGVFVDVNPV